MPKPWGVRSQGNRILTQPQRTTPQMTYLSQRGNHAFAVERSEGYHFKKSDNLTSDVTA